MRKTVGLIEDEPLAGNEARPAALVAEFGILTEQVMQAEKSFMDGSAEDGIALDGGGEPHGHAGPHLVHQHPAVNQIAGAHLRDPQTDW